MEKQVAQNEVPTKDVERGDKGVFLSLRDAEEFRNYKKQKKITEIGACIARSASSITGDGDTLRVCQRAMKLRQSAVKVPLTILAQAKGYLTGSGVCVDCVVGGTGETLPKVKAYETRLAIRRGAKEITLLIAPSLIDACRYTEIRREIRAVRRSAGKASVKVWVDKTYSPAALSRMARIASETGAKYFCVPYHVGCERLRCDLSRGCKLEVLGVEDAEDFKRLTGAGVGRIVTGKAWEIYNDWIKEANAITLEQAIVQKNEQLPPPTQEKTAQENTTIEKKEKKPVWEAFGYGRKFDPEETEYQCRLEGNKLKFF